jgi:hypothetical protein
LTDPIVRCTFLIVILKLTANKWDDRTTNMHEIDLDSWEAFEEQLQTLRKERLQQKWSANFLYRGQGNSTWELLTTLERNGKDILPLREYHHFIFVVKPQIESFTGTNWNIMPYPNGIDKWLSDNDSIIPNAFGWSAEYQDTYSYMAYLRHYGFPSPLLDWSSSPYVAAYFAFRNVLQCEKDVSIYVFLESKSEIGLKGGCSEKPYIQRLGPYVKTDVRHFFQQCNYTICIVHDGEWQYAPHEKAFARCDSNQDVLWKFNIPSSERLKVLKLLDSYNINALSLFGSGESLMETMALRELHFRERDR